MWPDQQPRYQRRGRYNHQYAPRLQGGRGLENGALAWGYSRRVNRPSPWQVVVFCKVGL